MQRQGGNPLIRPDDVGGVHQVVVHNVGKVIGGQAVLLDDNRVHNVLRHGDIPSEFIVEHPELPVHAGTAQPEHIALPMGQLLQDLLLGQIPADGPFAVVPFLEGVLLLLTLPQLYAVLLR